MALWGVSVGLMLLSLQSLALASKNFWLIQQRVLQLREERILKEVSRQQQQLSQGPASLKWQPLQMGYIRQPLDHFNKREPITFGQRFWINEQYWQKPGGPVFLYIGGESALSQSSVLSGHHVELAQKYGALLVSLEHRFYGRSINLDGLQDKNLQFLSSQQALSDLVSFHHYVTQKYGLMSNNTWICFGGSYPGSLAAWFRLKFPHLVFAAVSSSAPVRAQLDFTGYNKVVAASLSNPVVGGSKECLAAVVKAFGAVDGLIRSRQLTKVARDFHSCGALEGDEDGFQALSNLADIFMGAVQYNDESVYWGAVDGLCDIMTNHTLGTPYDRLIVANKLFLNVMELPCTDNSYADLLEELRSTVVSGSNDFFRQWIFQTCTEFGYYQTCEDSECPFSQLINLTSSLEICKEVFGISPPSIQDAVSFTNDYYGADHPKASRVLFVNGDIDPWHVLSVLKNQSSSELAILIHGTAHCANMNPSMPGDPASLVQAREQISSQVADWLKLAGKMHQGS
uniref:Thymus-specific serine protease n=1 Tax=Salvator merianae TaxID=96440 RepID=A0A8D0BRG3_SALMN